MMRANFAKAPVGLAVLFISAVGCASASPLSPEAQEALNQQLIQAAKAGDLDRCGALISSGSSVDALQGEEETPPQGVVPRVGSTPLHIAVARKDLPLLKLLLDRGADINHEDGWRYTPLEVYFESFPEVGPEEIALFLIESGANVNSHGGYLVDNIGGEGGSTPLHWAARNNLRRVAQALLDRGGDPNARASNGCTPLHWAGTAEIIRLLVKAGGDLEASGHDGLTPLAFAAWVGSAQTAVALLEAGAKGDPVLPEWMSGTLYHLAIHRLEAEKEGPAVIALLKALLKHGANVHRPDKFGQTPLISASSRRGELEEEMALILLAGGADPNSKDDNLDTPLHGAAETNRPRLVRELIKKGADVNSKSGLGITPLHYACWTFNGDPEVIQVLVKAGADIHAQTGDGKEPVEFTYEEHRARIASLLAGK